MIYPEEFESKIGFDIVRETIASLCESRMARECVASMKFSSSITEISRLLQQVSEMSAIMTSGVELPLDAIYDVADYLSEIRALSGYMSAEKVYKVMLMLRSIDSVSDFFSRQKEESGSWRYPALSREFSDLLRFPDIINEISRSVNKFGEIKDNASPELAEIRRKMAEANGSMARAMRRVMDRAVASGIVEKGSTPSMRDGRMVIPVNSFMKREINGIVHDVSASGKTVFIEPAEVVEAGNHLRELEMEERREIIVILMRLADYMRPHVDEIIDGVKSLGYLDFIRAKAKYAVSVDAQMPVVEKKREIDWFHALHPVLMASLRQQHREAVPLNIRLDDKHRILIISGPNAGGKSVCLKTVAIVQYMMQCGLLPTLYSNSHMGVFDSIFIDIGDEQSIENDLSTYSSHLRNMKYFVSHADKNTLVLADEMGSGTEPQIGGALAQAIIHKLTESGCLGVITTHYQNLKTFAESQEGLVNGAMLYDRQKLLPTFQLSIGNPGSSFAIDIARKIGLPASVIEEAQEIVGSDYVNMEKYLLDIARDRRYWANKRLSIKEKEHKLDNILDSYESKASDLKGQRAAILRDAREEAQRIIATANAKIENAIHDIKKAEAEKERTREIRRQIQEYKEELASDADDNKVPEALKISGIRRRKENKPKQRTQSECPTSIEVDSYVRMQEGGVVGKVLAINGKQAEVAFGALRTRVALSKLMPAKHPKETERPVQIVGAGVSEESRRRQLNFSNDIDVRGMRTDEAIQAVTYFIDDAVQFSVSKVRILHGTGHGILKTMIRQWLSSNPNVESMRDEDVRFGGAGITIVELK